MQAGTHGTQFTRDPPAVTPNPATATEDQRNPFHMRTVAPIPQPNPNQGRYFKAIDLVDPVAAVVDGVGYYSAAIFMGYDINVIAVGSAGFTEAEVVAAAVAVC